MKSFPSVFYSHPTMAHFSASLYSKTPENVVDYHWLLPHFLISPRLCPHSQLQWGGTTESHLLNQRSISAPSYGTFRRVLVQLMSPSFLKRFLPPCPMIPSFHSFPPSTLLAFSVSSAWPFNVKIFRPETSALSSCLLFLFFLSLYSLSLPSLLSSFFPFIPPFLSPSSLLYSISKSSLSTSHFLYIPDSRISLSSPCLFFSPTCVYPATNITSQSGRVIHISNLNIHN